LNNAAYPPPIAFATEGATARIFWYSDGGAPARKSISNHWRPELPAGLRAGMIRQFWQLDSTLEQGP
jgi:hypothetical protein